MQTIQEINRSVEASIGARNHTRQIYAEFICISYANIVATDMRYETDKKDIITWNMILQGQSIVLRAYIAKTSRKHRKNNIVT